MFETIAPEDLITATGGNMQDMQPQTQRSLPGAAGPTIFNPQGPSPWPRPTGPTFPRPPFPTPEFPPSRPWL